MSEHWKDKEPKWVPPNDGRIRRSPCEGRSFGQTTMDDEEYDRAQRAEPDPGTEAGELKDWGLTQVSMPPVEREPLSHRPYGASTLSDEDYEEEQRRVRAGLAPSGPFPHWDHDPLGKPRPMPK